MDPKLKYNDLTINQKKAYDGWFNIMRNRNWKMSVEEANKTSLEFVAKSSKILQDQEAKKKAQPIPEKKIKPTPIQEDPEDMFI